MFNVKCLMFNLLQQLLGHIRWLIAIGMLLQEVWEEKQLEYHEDNEQFYQYDDPQRLA